DEALQLRVLRARDQHLVDRIEHLLVVRHLVLDVGLVERAALERLQLRDVLLGALLQALARIARLGLHAELLRERRRLLIHGAVVGDHLLREVLDLLVFAFRLRELARVDVDLIRGDDDAGDLRIGGLSLRESDGGRKERDGQCKFPVHDVSFGLSRASTRATTRSQRSPAKLKASSQATSIFCASASRRRLRARKRRVRTVGGARSRTAAVSSTESSSTARSTNTAR